MKLCKDCKFFSEDVTFDLKNQNPTCNHPESQNYDDPVYGNHTKKSCHLMRSNNELCGMSGVLWIASAAFTPTEYSLL